MRVGEREGGNEGGEGGRMSRSGGEGGGGGGERGRVQVACVFDGKVYMSY